VFETEISREVFSEAALLNPLVLLLNSLAQLFGESFHLAHGHDAYAFAGEKFFDERVPRILSVRRRICNSGNFRHRIARMNAPSRVSQSLRLRQIAPQ
jgi:hypothetical protein